MGLEHSHSLFFILDYHETSTIQQTSTNDDCEGKFLKKIPQSWLIEMLQHFFREHNIPKNAKIQMILDLVYHQIVIFSNIVKFLMLTVTKWNSANSEILQFSEDFPAS